MDMGLFIVLIFALCCAVIICIGHWTIKYDYTRLAKRNEELEAENEKLSKDLARARKIKKEKK